MYKYFDIKHLNKSQRVIDRALLKHTFDNFRFEILEYCDKDVLLAREQHYLDLFKPEYNVATLAGNTLGYKHTPESLEKMRGHITSEEVTEKKRANVVKYATAAKMVPVIVENIITNEITEYQSVREAALALNVHNQSLSYALRNNSIFKKTYRITKK